VFLSTPTEIFLTTPHIFSNIYYHTKNQNPVRSFSVFSTSEVCLPVMLVLLMLIYRNVQLLKFSQQAAPACSADSAERTAAGRHKFTKHHRPTLPVTPYFAPVLRQIFIE
jgi:hypothetical protein